MIQFQQCTSVEQSNTLLSLRVPAETADMMWHRDKDTEQAVAIASGTTYPVYSTDIVYRLGAVPCNTPNLYSDDVVPAWSLGQLLKMIPYQIRISDIDYQFRVIAISNRVFKCGYFFGIDATWRSTISTIDGDLFKCLVYIIGQLTVNGIAINFDELRQ